MVVIHSVVALVLLCAVTGSTPLTIKVSDAGVDQPSCLLENTSQSCHTLEYALRQIPLINTTTDSLLLNILSDQYITGTVPRYKFNPLTAEFL